MRIIDNTLFTKREKEIVLLLLEGKTKQQIAEHLCLSVATIKAGTEKIYAKFNVHSKIELAVHLIQNKIVELN